MWEFDGELEFAWVMGGLARSYEHADMLQVVAQWLDDADAGGMPCDPRIWTENALDSTYPACHAVKAAMEQGREPGYRYLRTVREGIMCERLKLDRADALIDAAGRAGLDRDRFDADLRSDAIAEAFDADLEEVRDPPQEARDADAVHRSSKGLERISFPSAVFVGEDGSRRGVWGSDCLDPEKMGEAARDAGAATVNDPTEFSLKPLDAIGRFGRCATRELEVLSKTPLPALNAELWGLARDWQLRPIPVLTGMLWESA
jgi:hypothetical protein